MSEKKNPENNPQPQSQPAHDPQIDAIREIIFGQNIRQYNQQFEELEVRLAEFRKEMEGKIGVVKNELNQLIDNLREDTLQKLTDLRNHTDAEVARLDEAKADRRLMGNLLVEIGEKIRAENS